MKSAWSPKIHQTPLLEFRVVHPESPVGWRIRRQGFGMASLLGQSARWCLPWNAEVASKGMHGAQYKVHGAQYKVRRAYLRCGVVSRLARTSHWVTVLFPLSFLQWHGSESWIVSEWYPVQCTGWMGLGGWWGGWCQSWAAPSVTTFGYTQGTALLQGSLSLAGALLFCFPGGTCFDIWDRYKEVFWSTLTMVKTSFKKFLTTDE